MTIKIASRLMTYLGIIFPYQISFYQCSSRLSLQCCKGNHGICWQIHHSTKSPPAGVCYTAVRYFVYMAAPGARKTLISGSSPKYCPDITLKSKCFISQDNQGPDSISRWHLTSIGDTIADIKRSLDSLISRMEFPILVRRHLYIESGPRLHYLMIIFS